PTVEPSSDLRITITGTGGGETRTALMRLTPAFQSSSAFTIVGDLGNDICLIKNSGGDLDCRLFVTNPPGNAFFLWTFSVGGGATAEHDSSDPATKPEDGCGFLGGYSVSTDGNGDKFVVMTITLRIQTSSGVSNPASRTVNVYTQNYCGY
ncbi:MAG: hypothetical protein ABL993_10680, partial [Vicinamibacterales bacterium]